MLGLNCRIESWFPLLHWDSKGHWDLLIGDDDESLCSLVVYFLPSNMSRIWSQKKILVDYLLSEAYLCFRFHVGSLVVQDVFDVSGRHYTPCHVRSASSLILCQAALDFDWRHYPIIFFLNFTSCPKCYGGCPAGLFVCVQRWVQVNDCGVDGIVMCRTLKLILYICEALLKDKFNL